MIPMQLSLIELDIISHALEQAIYHEATLAGGAQTRRYEDSCLRRMRDYALMKIQVDVHHGFVAELDEAKDSEDQTDPTQTDPTQTDPTQSGLNVPEPSVSVNE